MCTSVLLCVIREISAMRLQRGSGVSDFLRAARAEFRLRGWPVQQVDDGGGSGGGKHLGCFSHCTPTWQMHFSGEMLTSRYEWAAAEAACICPVPAARRILVS